MFQSSEVENEVSEYLSEALLEKRQKSTGILGSEGHILPKIGKTSQFWLSSFDLEGGAPRSNLATSEDSQPMISHRLVFTLPVSRTNNK